MFFYKGQDAQQDSYSAFVQNDGLTSTGLIEKILRLGIQDWIIVGLATDYCVKSTALDAVKLGLKITIDLKACKSINQDPEFLEALHLQFKENGIVLI